MLPDRVSNPGPRTYESGALPIAISGPGQKEATQFLKVDGYTTFFYIFTKGNNFCDLPGQHSPRKRFALKRKNLLL